MGIAKINESRILRVLNSADVPLRGIDEIMRGIKLGIIDNRDNQKYYNIPVQNRSLLMAKCIGIQPGWLLSFFLPFP